MTLSMYSGQETRRGSFDVPSRALYVQIQLTTVGYRLSSSPWSRCSGRADAWRKNSASGCLSSVVRTRRYPMIRPLPSDRKMCIWSAQDTSLSGMNLSGWRVPSSDHLGLIRYQGPLRHVASCQRRSTSISKKTSCDIAIRL